MTDSQQPGSKEDALAEAIDEVIDWLDYDVWKDKALEQSVKKLRQAWFAKRIEGAKKVK